MIECAARCTANVHAALSHGRARGLVVRGTRVLTHHDQRIDQSVIESVDDRVSVRCVDELVDQHTTRWLQDRGIKALDLGMTKARRGGARTLRPRVSGKAGVRS
jgi:hypothetical protein